VHYQVCLHVIMPCMLQHGHLRLYTTAVLSRNEFRAY
jgi:hypothetical protein